MFYQSSTACVSKTNQTSNRNFPTRFSGERCQEDMEMFTTIISWVRRDWVWLPGFNVKTAVLTGATCLFSNSNHISSRASPTMKARQILKRDKRPRPVPVCCFARFASCDVKGRQVAHMSNIHKQIPIVKKPSPMVPLVKNHRSSKKPYDSHHWHKWKAPQSIGIPFVNCISLLLESRG